LSDQRKAVKAAEQSPCSRTRNREIISKPDTICGEAQNYPRKDDNFAITSPGFSFKKCDLCVFPYSLLFSIPSRLATFKNPTHDSAKPDVLYDSNGRAKLPFMILPTIPSIPETN
jgi:hypothetical protein